MNENKLLRSRLTEQINDSLKNFIDQQHPNAEKKLSFYSGQVVDNNDPDQQGRVRIRIFGVFDEDIPDNNLPWAIPDFNFIGSTLGSFVVPPLETLVKVYFENDDIYLPRYTTKVLKKDQMNDSHFIAGLTENYPDSMIFFETDTGEYFKINRATNVTTYRHSSGLMVDIDADGNLKIDNTDISISSNPNNASDSSKIGNITLNIKSNLDINVGGDMTIMCEGKFKVQSTENTIKAENLINPLGAKNKIIGPDSFNWVPNTLKVDPYTTAPHGGDIGIPPCGSITGIE
jgi:hypothetical protein